MGKVDIGQRLTIDNSAWQRHIEKIIADFRDSHVTDEGDFTNSPYFEPLLTFYQSGNLEPLLEFASNQTFVIDWQKILATNPSRDFNQYQDNIERFWEWVLEDEDTRIANPHLYDAPVLENYFWRPMETIYRGTGSGLCDPSINRRLFNEIYSETFTPDIAFPVELGKRKWQARKQLVPEELFTEMMDYLRFYLFYPHTSFAPAMILVALEYWFSIIPLIQDSYFADSGYFGLQMDRERYLDYAMDEDEERIFQGQDSVRRFFGLINGYKVCHPDDGDELCDNDPELVEYIRDRFSKMDLPDEYQKLIKFLHRHQENSLQVSDAS